MIVLVDFPQELYYSSTGAINTSDCSSDQLSAQFPSQLYTADIYQCHATCDQSYAGDETMYQWAIYWHVPRPKASSVSNFQHATREGMGTKNIHYATTRRYLYLSQATLYTANFISDSVFFFLEVSFKLIVQSDQTVLEYLLSEIIFSRNNLVQQT